MSDEIKDVVYEVLYLDVWGHSFENCIDYECPCIEKGEHDIDACECGYDVNDSWVVGKINITPTIAKYNEGTDREFTDYIVNNEQFLNSLIENGFLKESVTLSDIEVDSTASYLIFISRKRDNLPLYQLRVINED